LVFLYFSLPTHYRPSFPTRRSSDLVPRLTVTYSRKMLPSPTTSSARSPRKVESCGSPPIRLKGGKTLFFPNLDGPCSTASECSVQPSPNSTPSLTIAQAPTLTPLRSFGP